MVMTPAEKGERYARIFRRAGAFLGKGNIAHAAEVLKQGQMLAQSLGDSAMARRFADEIARVTSQPPE